MNISLDRLDARGLPRASDLTWWQLLALRELGGSGKNAEINAKASELIGLNEEQLSVMHTDTLSEVGYRYAWARTNLKNAGAIASSARAVWALTEKGWSLDEEGLRLWERERKQTTSPSALDEAHDGLPGDGEDDDSGWESQLLNALLKLTPKAFERLSQRLLREAGFINVLVTGRTGDGGIDGVGLYRPSLISFPVYFQCKRYRGSVGAPVIRDFRGAMAGRGEKGLVITTGTFTRDAVLEATRDGATSIELIDGVALCELLKDLRLGVLVVERVTEHVTVDAAFFGEFAS